MPHFVVLEDEALCRLPETGAELAAGRAVRTGWDRPDPRAVHVGTVADSEDAARAVLAALAGADLVVSASGDREVIDRLCDDLRRLGRLEHRVGGEPAEAAPPLSADERALLGLLLAGRSLGDAARALHLSRRTADRRLASARRALGADSTSEALVLARRLGIEPG